MTQKMIQIDVELLKQQFEEITSYYSDVRKQERDLLQATTDIDNGKYVSAYKLIMSVISNIDSGKNEVRKLRDMLTDAGCVLD
jgi:hypothetical protein